MTNSVKAAAQTLLDIIEPLQIHTVRHSNLTVVYFCCEEGLFTINELASFSSELQQYLRSSLLPGRESVVSASKSAVVASLEQIINGIQ